MHHWSSTSFWEFNVMSALEDNKYLYQILVPCAWNSGRPIRRKHHQEWDKRVRRITGGLTVTKPVVGQWIDENDGTLYVDRTIPVLIYCTKPQIDEIAKMTIEHYEQLAVMCFVVSDECMIVEATVNQKDKFSDVHSGS